MKLTIAHSGDRRDANALEISELKSSNQKLRSLLDEVGLEMAYYKAETKRYKIFID